MTAIEKGISHSPKIKLIRDVTPGDVRDIARITGGVTHPSFNPDEFDLTSKELGISEVTIDYPETNSHIQVFFHKTPGFFEVSSATLWEEDIFTSLTHTAIVREEDSISFICQPDEGSKVTIVSLSKNSTSRQKTRLSDLDDSADKEILQAVNLWLN